MILGSEAALLAQPEQAVLLVHQALDGLEDLFVVHDAITSPMPVSGMSLPPEACHFSVAGRPADWHWPSTARTAVRRASAGCPGDRSPRRGFPGCRAPGWLRASPGDEGTATRTAGMVRIEGDILISRPVDEVFDFVADERNEPRYNPRMRRGEKISAGPIGLGTRFRAETSTARGTAPMTVEITAYERPRRLTSSTRCPPWTSTEPSASIPFRAAPGCGGRGKCGRAGCGGSWLR